MKLTTKRPIALATLCLLISAAISTPNAFSYTTDSTVPLAGGCPQPNHWNLSLASPAESPLEHLPPAHQHHDPHRRRSRHARPTQRNRAIHLSLLRSLDRRPRHHLQHHHPSRPHRPTRSRRRRKFLLERSGKQHRRPQHNLLQSAERSIHHRRPRLHPRHHRQRPRRLGRRKRTRLFRRPNPRCRHPIPQRQPSHLRNSRRSRHSSRPGRLRSRIASRARARPLVRPRPFRRLARSDVSLRASTRTIPRRSPHRASARWPPLRRRPRRHPLSLSRSRRLHKHRHNQRPNSPRQSFRAREYPSPSNRIIRHGNFRRPRSSRRRRHRLSDRRHAGRLELQCSHPAVAFRRLLRNRAPPYKSQLQNLRRASRRLVTPANLSDPLLSLCGPPVRAHLHHARRKYKFQPPHPPRVALIHQRSNAPKIKAAPGGNGSR